MIPVLQIAPWCQGFPRGHKHLKGYEIVHLRSIYKTLLFGHYYQGIHYV